MEKRNTIADEAVIFEFIKSIERGPLKTLKNYPEELPEENDTREKWNCEENPGIYSYAVEQAWLDMCRTVQNISQYQAAELKKAKEKIADSIKNYFSGQPSCREKYDEWFIDLCNSVPSGTKLTIGQKQKIINMAFKYLYCCPSLRKQKAKHFDSCHMPLDSYTLAWYMKECKPELKEYHKEAWSKIDSIDAYCEIVKKIRDKVGNSQTVLQSEFSIWQAEKDKELIRNAKRITKSLKASDSLKKELERFIRELETAEKN